MPDAIVASNDFLSDRSQALRTLLDSAHALALWINNFQPVPADPLVSFIEASYPGYARKALAGQWGASLKLEDGIYIFSSAPQVFSATGPSNQLAYGWYVVTASQVKLSCRFPSPVLMTTGASITVRVDVMTRATSLE